MEEQQQQDTVDSIEGETSSEYGRQATSRGDNGGTQQITAAGKRGARRKKMK
jgi:hypothetical protein